MARIPQNALERLRDGALVTLQDLSEPLVVVDERAGDVIAPVVGNRLDQNVLDPISKRDRARADPAVVGQAGDRHECPFAPWAPCLKDIRTRSPNAR
jgi:hypothetical protein